MARTVGRGCHHHIEMQAGVTDVSRRVIHTAAMKLGHIRWVAFAVVAAGLVAGCTPSSGGGGHASTTTTTLGCQTEVITPRFLSPLDANDVTSGVHHLCPGETQWWMYRPVSSPAGSLIHLTTTVHVTSQPPPPAPGNEFVVELRLDGQTGPLMAPLTSEQVNPTVVGMADVPTSPPANHVVWLKVSAGPDTQPGNYVVFATGTSA